MRRRPAPLVVKSGSCPMRATASSAARSNASSRFSERTPGRRGRRSCRNSAAVKKPCTLFSRVRPSRAQETSVTGRCATGIAPERLVEPLQPIVGLTRIDNQHPEPRVRSTRDHLQHRINRKEMTAPEQQEEIEALELSTVREVRVDRRGRGLRSGEAPVALDAPVAKLRERPGDPECVALGGTDRAPVGLAVHADRQQVIAKIARRHPGNRYFGSTMRLLYCCILGSGFGVRGSRSGSRFAGRGCGSSFEPRTPNPEPRTQ